MKKYFILLSFLFFIPAFLFSQFDTKCGLDHKLTEIKKLDSNYAKSLEQPIPAPTGLPRSLDIITIPVHVIIVHPPGQNVGTGDNLSLDHIQSQIDVLNEDFRRLNGDAGNTPPEFPAADAMIEFCLAVKDPDGNDTDGVTRYGTTLNLNNNETAIKSATGWDRDQYLNIWVGPNIPYLGWAYLPTTTNLPNATLDGVVVLTGAFGGPGYGTTNNYDLGRTATHEVGHYLGLRHVWGSGGCGNDDGIDDTPIQSGSNFGCPNHPSPSCGNAGDMFMNYMDYVDDDCMNAFTEDQSAYMNLILNTSRSSLLDAAATNCDATVPLTVEIISQEDVLCFGESTGTVTVQASGGVGGYTYAINGGPFQNSGTFTNLSAGQHIVEAMDDDASTVTIDVTIMEPPMLIPNIDTQLDVTCFGDANGMIIASAFGGTPAPGGSYLYSLDGINFSTENIFDNLEAGLYTLTVQDNNFCQAVLQTIINSPEELVSLPDDIQDVDCFGNENGSISILTLGGTPIYSYSIDQVNYQNENFFFNLSPGDYIATTIDANACVSEFPFTITEPEPLELIVADQEDVLCFEEANGSITLESVGGTSEYLYSIDDVNYQNEPFFDGLSAGSYTLYVIDANGCSSNTFAEIEEPEALIMEVDDQTNVDCFGGNNGTVTLTAAGGTGGYIFTLGDESIANETATFENLEAGFHTISLEDENNCEILQEIEITENPAIELETIMVENVSCFEGNDGIIEVLASGGAGDFVYSINGGDFTAEPVFNDLPSGNYTIVAQDILDCINEIQLELTAPDEINTQIESQENPACFNESTGTVQVSATGGTGTITYTLGNISNTSGIFEDLAAGDYNILVEDENNCTDFIDVLISEPEEINLAELSNTSVDCNGNNSGGFQVSASGGTGAFTYTVNGNTNTTGEFENLTAGTYDVLATDDNACTQSLSVEIAEPEILEASIESVTNINCAGANSGAIQVIASGGTGNPNFTLNGVSNTSGYFDELDLGDYTILVSDENDCETSVSATVESSGELEIQEDENIGVTCFGENNGSVQLSISGATGNFEFTLNGETNTTGLFENLAAGIYTAMATDGEDCSGSLEFSIEEPEALAAQVDQQSNIACFGEATGNFQISASGGTQAYHFTLGNEENDTGFFENLIAGDYEITATDANNCQTTVAVTLEQAAELSASISAITEVSCAGESSGAFLVVANGGTGTYQYTSNGETNTNGAFNNLSSGDYDVLVSDENDCTFLLAVTVPEPSALSVSTEASTMITCFNGDDGTVQFQANGGAGDFTYTFNNEVNTTGTFENLSAGNFELIVSDANGCTISSMQSINQPDELTAEVLETTNNNCFDEKTGTAQLGASGGTGAYEFTLGLNSNTSGYFENLASGTFEVIITDENGCTVTQSFNITQPTELLLELVEIQDIDCINNPVGSVQVQASGGTGSYEYQFGNESNGSGFFGNLNEGLIEISVTDENDCLSTIAIEIGATQEIEAEIITLQDITCFGENNGSVLINGIGGTGVYTYTLGLESNTSGIFENLSPGVYEAFIIDENNCDAVLEFTISEPEEMITSILELQDVDCFGDATGSVAIQTQGGMGDYSYNLNGEINENGVFESLPAGNYEAIITDLAACTSTFEFSVAEPVELEGEIIEITPLSCFGQTAKIETIAWGGTMPYSFTLDGETNTTGQFEDIEAGTYEMEIVDANACLLVLPFEIIEAEEIIISVENIQNVDCYDNNSGAIQLLSEGGAGGFIYDLEGESNLTGYFENLSAGTYTAVVTDVNSCTNTVDFEITEPTELSLSTTATENDLGGGEGSMTLEAQGGTAPYQFSLNNMDYQASNVFENLTAGIYSVFVKDANDCITEITVEIEFETSISDPENGVDEISVSPNPFSEVLNLDIKLLEGQQIQLRMFTIHGKELYAEQFDLGQGAHNLSLNVPQNLAAGTYILTVQTNQGYLGAFRLVKQ